MEIKNNTNTIFLGASSASSQRLSVLKTTDSLCLFTYDINHALKSIYSINRYEGDSFQAILKLVKEEFDFKRLDILYADERFSLMPNALFLYGNERRYLNSVCALTDNDILFTDHNDAEQIVNTYAVKLREDLMIRQVFDGARTKHFTTEMIGSTRLESETLYVYILTSIAFCISINDNKPNIVTSFKFNSTEDFLYNIGSINNLNLIPAKGFVLCGFVDENQELYQAMNKFYSNVRLFDSRMELNASIFVK